MFELDSYRLNKSEPLPLESSCFCGPVQDLIFVKLVRLLQWVQQFLLLYNEVNCSVVLHKYN
jgi:hypothetical protein